MNVRFARVTDAAVLSELTAQLGYSAGPTVMAARLSDILGREDHRVLVTCDDTDIPVGWIHVAERRLLESPPHAEILGLVVDAGCRREGRGERLVRAVEAWATRRGLPFVSVRSNIARAESHPFYERLGYARVKTQHAYRKTLDEH